MTLTHANLLANIRAMGKVINAKSDDVFVSWLPVYHDMGLIGAWLGSLYHAIPLVIMSPLLFLTKPQRWLWAIHHHRGTLSPAPNFAYELCVSRVKESDSEGLDLSTLATFLEWRRTRESTIDPKLL
ncbi:AMP-binding protein [Vibrio sp. M60_M31a]